MLIEVFLGEVRGQALFETVDAAIRIFKARSRAASASASASAPGRPDPSTENDVEDGNAAEEPATTGDEGRKERLVRGLPQLVGAAVTAGMELRIQAPRHHHHNDGISQEKPADPTTSSDDSDDSDADPFADAGDPTDPFFRSWAAPEILCLSFPSGQISFGGEYRDRSVRRSEMDRRAAKRAAKQKRQNSAASKSGSRTNVSAFLLSPVRRLSLPQSGPGTDATPTSNSTLTTKSTIRVRQRRWRKSLGSRLRRRSRTTIRSEGSRPSSRRQTCSKTWCVIPSRCEECQRML